MKCLSMSQQQRKVLKVALLDDGAKVFVPGDEASAAFLAKAKPGKKVEATTHLHRSPPQLRLYWSLLGRCVKATDGWPYPTAEDAHDAIKMALGYVNRVWSMKSAQFVLTPRSVAMHAMPHAEFNEFFERAQALIFTEWLADADVGQDALNEINQMLDRLDQTPWEERRLANSKRINAQ